MGESAKKWKNLSMKIPWVEKDTPLPAAHKAQPAESPLAGLVAAGDDLSVQRLLEAYSQGMFPWFNDTQPVLWWSPDPRMVLEVKKFKLHRSLRKTLTAFQSNSSCDLRIDTAFERVIEQCATSPRKGQPGTWIVPKMIEAYVALHRAGFAHSFETWVDQKLVGGLYCVSIGDAVFGESMFSKQSDASKIALSGLVAFARSQNLAWIDCQQNTPHLASMGAQEVPRLVFLQWVENAAKQPTRHWQFCREDWSYVLGKFNQ